MGFNKQWAEVAERRGLIADRAPIAAPALDCSEDEFQSAVIKLAKSGGFLVYHTYDSRRSEKGFPDLCMVRLREPRQLIFAELKREGEKPTPEQLKWLAALRAADVACYVWMPSYWPEIVEALK